MFTKDEIKRNLLGGLEVALFMPQAKTRFGQSYEEALRSFFVPAILFPMSLFLVYIYPHPDIEGASLNTISLLYCLRAYAVWGLFLGAVYWILSQIDRKEKFYQFVTASNWLAVPSSIVLIPVVWMIASGNYTPEDIYPFTMCLIFYTYAFTAFMASYILCVPMELAGFIVFISIGVNDSTMDIVNWVGKMILS